MPQSPAFPGADLCTATQRFAAFMADCLTTFISHIRSPPPPLTPTPPPSSSPTTPTTPTTSTPSHYRQSSELHTDQYSHPPPPPIYPSTATTTTSTTTPPPLSLSVPPLPPLPQPPQTTTAAVTDSAFTSSSAPSSPSPPSTPPSSMLAVAASPASTASSSPETPDQTCSKPNIKRPKLSLQTSCVPVALGKSTTALSFGLTACYPSSPTLRNTFSNAYDGFSQSDNAKSTTGTGAIAMTTTTTTPTSTTSCYSSASMPPRYHSTAPLRSASPFVNSKTIHDNGEDAPPYQLPLGVRSILRNSPIPRSGLLRRPSLSAPAGNGRRKLFPATKRVNYRYPIEEEIKTVRFLAKHSDLFSSTDSSPASASTDSDLDSIASLSPDDDADDGEESDSSVEEPLSGSSVSEEDDNTRSQPIRKRKRRRYSRSDRQILAAGIRDGLLGERGGVGGDQACETPQTPVRTRRKRPREWKWTLGPIKDGYVQPTSSPETVEAGTDIVSPSTTTLPAVGPGFSNPRM